MHREMWLIFNVKDPQEDGLKPDQETGWTEKRRISYLFLQTLLTHSDFINSTPFSGIRISGALIDDAPVNLEHARLQNVFWLKSCRILTDVMCSNLRVDGELRFESSYFEGDLDLHCSSIEEELGLSSVILNGAFDLGAAKLGSNLLMEKAIFRGKVNLNSASVRNSIFVGKGSVFRDFVDLGSTNIGGNLEMQKVLCEKKTQHQQCCGWWFVFS